MSARPDDRIDLTPWDGVGRYDHAPQLRESETLGKLWSSPLAKVIDLDRDGRFAGTPLGAPTSGELDPDTAFLGMAGEVPWFARRCEPIAEGGSVRDADFTELEWQLVMSGLAVLNWAERARFCARCGGRLQRTKGGFAAHCQPCGAEHFPRTDPAVIVAVVDPDDRLFLAHQVTWPANRVSILAGFVESGESAENALFREVVEEAKLDIDAYRYLGSQPWPYPRSLMLAYVARSRSEGLVDGVELEWGGFYSREDVDRAEAEGSLILPGPGSIASKVIVAWRAGLLPAPE